MKEEESLEIIILFRIKNRIIKDYSFNKKDITFRDILLLYDNIKKEYNQYQLKSKYFYHEKELKINDSLLDLLISDDVNLYSINQIVVEIYLDEIYNIDDEEIPKYFKLVIPVKNDNSLELYVYYPEKGTIDIEEYYKNIFDEYLLYKINDKTSICNSNNYLFLSGGEYNDEIIDDFWIIDNTQYSIKHIKLPSPKTKHSLYNINNEYILIIGGNDTKTYLYNIEKKEFIFFENTNNIHINPKILFFKNYIYCFSIQNEIIIAEKKLFTLEEKYSWENISFIDFDMDINMSENDSLLIILDNKKYYEFVPEKNILKKIILNDEENYEINISSNDKNFYKLNKYYNACIPKNFKNEKILYVLNKKTRKIHKMEFSGQRYIIKEQYKENNDIINKENLLIIKTNLDKEKENIDQLLKLHSSKRVLNNLNEEDDLINFDNKIINESSLLKEEDTGLERKSSKNSINLIIPKNVIYEQLTQPTFNLEDNENIEKNGHTKELHIDLNNLFDGNEAIFTPIKRDLPSPFGLSDANEVNQNRDDRIIFEQSIENINDNSLDSFKDKGKKRSYNLKISGDIIDDQLVSREIKNENNLEKKITNEINDEESTQKKEEIINNDSNQKEERNDLFISDNAYAI